MPHAFHTRLTDTQAAAIDAVATFTDPTTGLLLSVSRQDVVHSILNQWMAQHAAAAPGRTALAATDEGARTVREETIQTIADSAGLSDPGAEALTPETPPVPVGDDAPVPSTRVPRKKKAKATAKKRPTSAALAVQPEPSPLPAPVPVDWQALDRAATAALAQTLRSEGLSYEQVVARFNDAGVPTLSRRGRWSKGSVERLVKAGLQEG